ncbi:hypothetical protein LOD99_10345 [Oopsacas minuta]|uniref:Uncharacterized protein n=1 Tax=Oopsacas minuta TaxID=111878 RepID=A0AAV7KIC9_9METZ|nr:hypothetical protein LOD99_10345 [Oopsacas minuta]
MCEKFPSQNLEITIVYQRMDAPRPEIQLLSIQVREVQDHQLAYSRFKSSVCRLFQLPKSTPFMIKDTVSGAKMTRDRFSEYLKSKSFPLVWRMITALPGEEGVNKITLSQMDSCATGTTDSSTNTLDLSPQQTPKTIIDTNQLHSIARTLSLGWNEHTNTYGLETKTIQIPNSGKQLIFISKRAQNLSVSPPPAGQSSLSVGDLILKIEGRSVTDMSREEIGIHLNYPLANLRSISLGIVPWTETPQDIKDIISEAIGYELEPTSNQGLTPNQVDVTERLPTTNSEPNFWTIPVSSIDDPISPEPIKTPNTSPRKRKARYPFSTGSAVELVSQNRSPNKKMGILTGTKGRTRALSSCTRSDSFNYIPSDPLSSCPVSEPTVPPPEQPINTSDIGLLASSTENIPKLLSDTNNKQELSNTSSDGQNLFKDDFLLEPNQISADTNVELTLVPSRELLVDSNPEETTIAHQLIRQELSADINPELSDEPELPEVPDNSKPELNEILDDTVPEVTMTHSEVFPQLTLVPFDMNPELISADTKLELSENSADINPEVTLVPFDMNPELISAYTKTELSKNSADINPEVTLVSYLQNSDLDHSPVSNLDPFPSPPQPPIRIKLSPLGPKFSRSASDSKTNRLMLRQFGSGSSSSDMDTEDTTGMHYVTDPPNVEEKYNILNHPFEPFDDTFQPPKTTSHLKVSQKQHSSRMTSLEKFDSFRRFLTNSKSENYDLSANMPIVSDLNTTIVSNSCTEFINPSFQGSVHGVYRSFDMTEKSHPRKPSSKRRVSHLEAFEMDTFKDVQSTNDIAYYSTDESDYENDDSHFHTSRHMTAVPIGLITPVRPRKLAVNRDPDPRPLSGTGIPRSNSEASNLSGGFYEDEANGVTIRARLMRKQKAMLSSPHVTADSMDYFNTPASPPQLPNGNRRNFISETVKVNKSSLYSGKPSEFVHPAYRPYQSIGNMEITERMCDKLREKFQPITNGPLSRKHEFDGRNRRKAQDRSWKNLYVQLHESDLIFYKSEAAYNNDKPNLKSLTRDRGDHHFQYDHIVSLHHAKLYIPNDYMAVKRNTTSYVFRIQTENTSTYLIRALSLPLMFGWILSFIEARVLPPTDHPHSIGLFQDLDKRQKNTIEGANRYIQRIQQKMRSKLFTRRDSEISLEPIFGPSILKCAHARENEKIPLFVEMCVKEIEERGMESDGIYRVSGTARNIKSLRDDMSRGVDIDPDDERWADENNIAGLFKLFFKELTEPLVSADLYNSLIGTISKTLDSQGQLIREVQRLIQSMPDTNLNTLDYVVAHLCRVAQCSTKNRMSVRNLAIVFGPTLITRRDLTSIELISQTNAQVCIMELLILHYDHVFNCKPIKDQLFDSKRCPSSLSTHSIVRQSRNSTSGFPGDKIRRVSSTDPPLPSTTPPPPYPDPHEPLDSKLSRSWSEEVLTRVNIIGESFGSELFRGSPTEAINTSSTLPRGRSGHSPIEQTIPHPLSNTHWHIPLDHIPPSIVRIDRSNSKKNSTFF